MHLMQCIPFYHTVATRKICQFLGSRGLRVLVEPHVAKHEITEFEACDPAQPTKDVDIMICVGGDGTMLHVAKLIQGMRARFYCLP